MQITTVLNDTSAADELVHNPAPGDSSLPSPNDRGAATPAAGRWFTTLSLSRVLRWSGGGVLTAAGISFML